MATGYRHSGDHEAVATASGAIASGATVYQEGIFGVAITGAALNKSLTVATKGVWVMAVPSGTVKGDILYADLSSESTAVTLVRTGMTAGMKAVGVARGDRDNNGNALVKLGSQPFGVYDVSAGAAPIAVAALTDNSGGAAADGTIGVVDTTPHAADAVKELATKVNEVIAGLKTAGIFS